MNGMRLGRLKELSKGFHKHIAGGRGDGEHPVRRRRLRQRRRRKRKCAECTRAFGKETRGTQLVAVTGWEERRRDMMAVTASGGRTWESI